MPNRRFSPLVTGAALLAIAAAPVGCNPDRPPEMAASQPREPERSAPREPARNATQPGADESPTAENPSDAAKTEKAADEEIPKYIKIVERIAADEPVKLDAALLSPGVLRLNTQNIKRIKITRQDSPLVRDGSVALRIDGKGIEWTRRYETIELERTPAGDWVIIDAPPKP